MNEARENFKNIYGRLLAEEEAINLAREIKANLKMEDKNEKKRSRNVKTN